MPLNFRKELKSRLTRLGKSKNWLSEQIKSSPSRNAIYSYLRGDTDMAGENIARLFAVIEKAEKESQRQK